MGKKVANINSLKKNPESLMEREKVTERKAEI